MIADRDVRSEVTREDTQPVVSRDEDRQSKNEVCITPRGLKERELFRMLRPVLRVGTAFLVYSVDGNC